MAEKEYIERRALINELNKLSDECEYYGEWEDCISSYESDLFDIVEKVPTADVQEIRYGKPVQMLNDVISEKTITVCSCCNGKISKKDTWCKHCGAKMKKERL